MDLFEEQSRRGKTIVMVTHDPSLTARTGRTLVISDGLLVKDNRADVIKKKEIRKLRERI
jgi:predicted ABC-type transport system involved in lysophospholipase L1 biosynthesis ATPase subunit